MYYLNTFKLNSPLWFDGLQKKLFKNKLPRKSSKLGPRAPPKTKPTQMSGFCLFYN